MTNYDDPSLSPPVNEDSQPLLKLIQIDTRFIGHCL
jgi:hypothetical protein